MEGVLTAEKMMWAWAKVKTLTVTRPVVLTPEGEEMREEFEERVRREDRFEELRVQRKTFGEINEILREEGFTPTSGPGVLPWRG